MRFHITGYAVYFLFFFSLITCNASTFPISDSISPDGKYSLSITLDESARVQRLDIHNIKDDNNVIGSANIVFLTEGEEVLKLNDAITIKWNTNSNIFIMGLTRQKETQGQIVALISSGSSIVVSPLKTRFQKDSEMVSYRFTTADTIEVVQKRFSGELSKIILNISDKGVVRGQPVTIEN